ncbi:glycosyltransferase family 4 protein [Caenispirillum salinarum]|uniref:glycosyltransferase family 4 protein n=1 Tax=Caenispirillum salinarum TaxID=859058 RepID=UPI00384ABB11
MNAVAPTPVPRCVLMTADTVGGVWTYALELARGLTARGARLVIATMGRAPTDAQMRAARSIDGVILECSDYALEWMPDDPWDEVAAAGDWLMRLQKRYRPDLVHLNGYAHGRLPWRAPVVVAAHSDVVTWFDAVKGEPPPPLFERYQDEARAGLAAADLVIAPTQAYLHAVTAAFGHAGPARAVRNGLGDAPPQPPEKAPVVLAAGRVWDEAKNMAVLGEAAARGPWPLRIAGDAAGPDGEAAPPPGVNTLGRLEPDALAQELAEAAVFCAPSVYEPFGLGPLEAARTGCALVLSDISTFRELWDGAALFVPAREPAAWAEACAALADDAALRRRLAAAALDRARRYTNRAMTDATLAAYAAAAGHAPKAAVLAAE